LLVNVFGNFVAKFSTNLTADLSNFIAGAAENIRRTFGDFAKR
jgi:hypothetical protein